MKDGARSDRSRSCVAGFAWDLAALVSEQVGVVSDLAYVADSLVQIISIVRDRRRADLHVYQSIHRTVVAALERYRRCRRQAIARVCGLSESRQAFEWMRLACKVLPYP